MPVRVGLAPRSGALRGAIRLSAVPPRILSGIGTGNVGGRTVMPGGPSPIQGHVFDAATPALWRFDEAADADDAVDLSGNYNLTQFGTPTVVPGKVDNGRRLDGSSMFFQKQGDAPLGLVFNGDWTFETWFNLDPSTATGDIFFYGGLNYTTVNADVPLINLFAGNSGPTGFIAFRNWRNTSVFDTGFFAHDITFGAWHHLALTRSELFASFFQYTTYIDGEAGFVYNMSLTDFPITGDTHYIGVGNHITPSGLGTAADLVTGQVDDMRISNYARNDSEIRISYDRGIGG